jgi:peptidoglycan hydrolase-like protein with peptidoglycan-binding domain
MSLKLIQQGLKGLRYDVGVADDRWGPKTRSAAEAFIANHGQPADVRPAVAPVSPGTPRMYQGSARYLIDEIVLHCSDTRPDWMAGATFAARFAEIRRWHMQDRGWKDIGYHWVIDRDGSLLAGRPETVIGAGVASHNNGVIHISMLGGHGSAETDRFSEHFTLAQDAAVRGLIRAITARTTITRVSGHNEWAAKACPGFYVPSWLKETAA